MKIFPPNIKVIFGFPAADGTRRNRPRGVRQRGIALLLAVIVISMAMVFAADLILSSHVSMEMVAKNRDNVRAEYMARSAANLAVFLLTADYGLDWFMRSERSPMPTEPKDGPGDIWSMLNGIPLGGDTLDMLLAVQESFGLSSVNDAEVIDMFRLFDGNFVLNVSDESARINVNMCAQGHCIRTLAMLQALMSCNIERSFLEGKNINPDDLIMRIREWVSRRGSSDQDEPYLRKQPPYRAKHGPFYSIEELRLIDGWDEEVHAVFSPYLTVFPYQERATDKQAINLNTASKALLSCLLPRAKIVCNEQFAVNVHSARTDQQDLAADPNSVKEVLASTFCTTPAENEPGSDRDPTSWFGVRSDTYRINVTGNVGAQVRRLQIIVERTMPDPRRQETGSYKVLDWKVL